MPTYELVPFKSKVPDPGQGGVWDTVALGDVYSPGIASVSVVTARSVDKAKAKGNDGITLTDNGAEAAHVKIDIRCPKELGDSLIDFISRIDPRKNKPTQPLAISHPYTIAAQIDNVYVERVTWQPYATTEAYRVSIECVEWFKETKKTKAKTGSTNKNASKTKGQDAAQKAKNDIMDAFDAGSASGENAADKVNSFMGTG